MDYNRFFPFRIRIQRAAKRKLLVPHFFAKELSKILELGEILAKQEQLEWMDNLTAQGKNN